MATYIELVNKVIRESGNELNELNPTTWVTAAGQRMYPRLRDYVRQAWKMIQMERDQWEFNNASMYDVVFPRMKFVAGIGSVAPQPGAQFRGEKSDMLFTIRRVILDSGDWVNVPASGQIEFVYENGNTSVLLGEVFKQVGGTTTFSYTERGSYDFGLDKQDLAEIRWDTLVGHSPGSTSHPIAHIPWENWFYNSYAYNVGTRVAPSYASQDYSGNMVFYPQTVDPFTINFIYTATPQELTNYDDVPARIPEQYHEWIAWEALLLLATYDKNTMLAQHAQRNALPYRRRAEKNLMPPISYRGSKYNE